jgi:hypothetical protein
MSLRTVIIVVPVKTGSTKLPENARRPRVSAHHQTSHCRAPPAGYRPREHANLGEGGGRNNKKRTCQELRRTAGRAQTECRQPWTVNRDRELLTVNR